MGIVVFIVLAVVSAMAIVYPLLPGARSSQIVPVVTDGDIEQAVRRLRRSPAKGGLSCPSCGRPYQAGDRFCVGCGAALAEATPLSEAAPAVLACSECGTPLREGDRFCPRCGHNVAGQEVA
jgi:predicted amidophosphoribosyltransferase